MWGNESCFEKLNIIYIVPHIALVDPRIRIYLLILDLVTSLEVH